MPTLASESRHPLHLNLVYYPAYVLSLHQLRVVSSRISLKESQSNFFKVLSLLGYQSASGGPVISQTRVCVPNMHLLEFGCERQVEKGFVRLRVYERRGVGTYIASFVVSGQ